MKLISITAENFGSYKNLRLDFNNKGLTLISGPTGAGKSTIMDSVSWVLFGKTAKNGSADEVVKWGSTETTSATIEISLTGKESIIITRTRNPNDLHYTVLPALAIIRGKDLKDTQLKLNQLLGITPETFLAAVYMHEFSLTSEFFQTNAKNRRQIMEQLTDLSLAKTLQENSADYAKMLKQDLEKWEAEIKLAQAVLKEKHAQLADQKYKWSKWEIKQSDSLSSLKFEADNFNSIQLKSLQKLHKERQDFEDQRNIFIVNIEDEIAAIECSIAKLSDEFTSTKQALISRRDSIPAEKCLECGSVKNAAAHMLLQRDEHKNDQISTTLSSLIGKKHTLTERIERHKRELNPYDAKIEAKSSEPNLSSSKYVTKLAEINPYEFEDLENQIEDKESEFDAHKMNKDSVQIEAASVKLLQEVIQQFRGRIISNTVSFLQNKTNKFLETHFEAEFRVAFTIAEADSLDTEVYKDGILCSYTQLSKGQRQMLKLCFGAAIQLAVANYSGVQFNTIFMDEVLTGLDETNKGKAFGLIQELASSYENIYIIEHNESFKTLFTSRIDVTLENGNSIIHEQS